MLAPRRIIHRATGNNARVASIPAPVGGWNVRDSLANMSPMDAVTLTNLFPTVSNVAIRGGFTEYATGMNGQIQTLMTYTDGHDTELFAIDATGKNIYDVSSAGAVGAPVVTGLTNAVWQHTNISTPGGSYLVAVNGTDAALIYDGSTWTTLSITGVANTVLENVLLFKNRLWFIEKRTLKAWYLPTQSISGAAQMFDLRSVCSEGGHLVDFEAWTVDAGYGVDDNLVFITSQGEVLVYRGTDPASSATWGAAGVWKLGSPVGHRCMMKYGGDVLILTYDGLLPLAQALQSSRLDPRVALSDKIQGAIATATTLYGNHSSIGWQITYYAKANALLINVPVSVGSQEQYVMNTITQAWCRFTGWAANCLEVYNDDLYFGADGVVCLAWNDTYTDDTSNIDTVAIQAFNYFEQRGIEKYFTRARPTIFTNGNPSIQVGMSVDYQITETVAPISYTAQSVGLWDSAVWDTSLWGQSLTTAASWSGVTGVGYCGAVQFQGASQGVYYQWASTDIVYQAGWAGI
tara:strand:- start:7530 stop:9086 length:1557 start_codon:yes stop_codon:yes gene_type:complete